MSIVQVVIDSDQPASAANQHFFAVESVYFTEEADNQLEVLIHQVSKTPKDLIRHSQRIYYCFFHQYKDHLFAALTDLLLFLQGKGQDFAHRMIEGTQSLLTGQQTDLLRQALKFNDFSALQTIKFSLFASGRLTTLTLVEKRQDSAPKSNTDALSLAQDFIEYSQLDQAMDVLEQAFFDSDREDIQQLLLELYRSTKSISRFSNIYQQAREQQKPLTPGWTALQQFFSDELS